MVLVNLTLQETRPRKGDGVDWLRNLVVRWGARNFSLVCPHCRQPASPAVFRRGRYRLGEETLACERCGETNLITFWRFEGLSGCGSDPSAGPPLTPGSHRAVMPRHAP